MNNENTEKQIPSVRRLWFFVFFLAALAFLYLRTFLLPATPLVAFGDEVHYFIHAVRIMDGQLPYRDFFTFVFPGADLLYAGIFRLLGVSQWVAQGIVLVLGLLLTLVITRISGAIMRGSSVLLPGLLFLVFDFNNFLDATHHWWSTLFVMGAVALLARGSGYDRIAGAGVLCGFATLFTQTQGALGVAAIAFYLVWVHGKNWRPLVRELSLLIAPFAIITGSVLSYYASRMGLSTIAYWTVYFPIVYFPTLKGHKLQAYFIDTPTFHKASDLVVVLPYLFIHLIVPFVYLFCIFRLIRERDSMEETLRRKILLLCLVGLALFATVMTAATYLRICVVAPPAVILCVWLLNGAGRTERKVMAALWMTAIFFVLYLPVRLQLYARYYLDLPTGRAAFVDVARFNKLRWFMEHIHPGESIFDEPFVVFSLSLKSPGPLDYVRPAEFTRPEQVDEQLRSMSIHKTRFVFLYPELYGHVYDFDNLEPLRRYLAENYHQVPIDFDGQVWERN